MNEMVDSALGEMVWPIVLYGKENIPLKLPPGKLWFTDDGYVVANPQEVDGLRADWTAIFPSASIIGIHRGSDLGYTELHIDGNQIPRGKTLGQILKERGR